MVGSSGRWFECEREAADCKTLESTCGDIKGGLGSNLGVYQTGDLGRNAFGALRTDYARRRTESRGGTQVKKSRHFVGQTTKDSTSWTH